MSVPMHMAVLSVPNDVPVMERCRNLQICSALREHFKDSETHGTVSKAHHQDNLQLADTGISHMRFVDQDAIYTQVLSGP